MSCNDTAVYLVWSHDAHQWWKPGGSGYTGDVWEAGRFTWQEADRKSQSRTWPDDQLLPPEVMVLAPEDGHPTFTAVELRGLENDMNNRIASATEMARDRRAAGGGR